MWWIFLLLFSFSTLSVAKKGEAPYHIPLQHNVYHANQSAPTLSQQLAQARWRYTCEDRVKQDQEWVQEQRGSKSARRHRAMTVRNAERSWHDKHWGVYVSPVDNAKSDNEFLVRAGFGNPVQWFWTAIDSGSADVWVYSQACCFSEDHRSFNPSKSVTFANRTLDANGNAVRAAPGQAAQLFDIEYGSSSVETYLGYDTTRFEVYGKDIRVENQTIGLVLDTEGGARGTRKNEALMGIAPSAHSVVPGGIKTVFEQLVDANFLSKPMLSITFVKTRETPFDDRGGRLVFGEVDHAVILGDVTWINSTAQTFWGGSFPAGSIRFGGKDIWDPKNPNLRFIVDTGSSILFLPKYTTDLANKMISDAYWHNETQKWLIPCKTGRIGYEVNDRVFGVPPRDLVMYPDQPFNASTTGGRKDHCLSSIQFGTDQFAVLGNTFIKNVAITFDYGHTNRSSRRIGFARRKDTGILLNTDLSIQKLIR